MIEPTACTLEKLFVVKLQFLIVKKDLYTEITAGRLEGFIFLPRSVDEELIFKKTLSSKMVLALQFNSDNPILLMYAADILIILVSVHWSKNIPLYVTDTSFILVSLLLINDIPCSLLYAAHILIVLVSLQW